MDGLELFVACVNLVVSACILLILVYREALPGHATKPPGTIIIKRKGVKIKPIVNDEYKEWASEQREMSERPSVI